MNEHQWQQVRTPEFKAWFGDWERVAKRNALDSMAPVEVDYSAFGDRLVDPAKFEEKAKAAYASIKKATNAIDRTEIQFVMTGYRKMLPHSADASTLEIVTGLKQMMERAIPIYSEPHTPSEKPNASTRARHTYAARAVLDRDPVYVKLVVREDVFGKRTIDAFHDATVTPEKEVRAAGLRSSAPLSMQEETAWPSTPDKNKLRQWYGAVNPSFLGPSFLGPSFLGLESRRREPRSVAGIPEWGVRCGEARSGQRRQGCSERTILLHDSQKPGTAIIEGNALPSDSSLPEHRVSGCWIGDKGFCEELTEGARQSTLPPVTWCGVLEETAGRP